MYNLLLIPGLKIVFALAGNTDPLDLGSVIIDCGDKHYNKGISPGYLYVMQWEAT